MILIDEKKKNWLENRTRIGCNKIDLVIKKIF